MLGDPRDLWATALGELQVQLPKANYETWLKGTQGLSLQGDELSVGVPSPFVAEWLERHLSSVLQSTVSRIARRPLVVKLVISQVNAGQGHPQIRPSRERKSTEPSPTGQMPLSNGSGLNSRYTFENFAIGPSNQLAYAAAVSVAEKPGTSYNPLFIYAGVGLGKTHILQAIGHRSLVKELSILYISSEQFTNDFISAIASRRTAEFREKYRATDILMVDDIQFLSGKESTQESFFHTFNSLYNSNRQVVIASDRPPSEMELMEDRLRSRFEGGLMVDIQPPEWETRIAIIRLKAQERSIELDSDTSELLAQETWQSVRELEGILNKVAAMAGLQGNPISPDLLKGIVSRRHRTPPTPKGLTILETVAQFFSLTTTEVTGRSRNKKTIEARDVAIYLLREESHYTLQQIGKLMGSRDHSTVVHAYQKIAARVLQDEALTTAIQNIKQSLPATQEIRRKQTPLEQ